MLRSPHRVNLKSQRITQKRRRGIIIRLVLFFVLLAVLASLAVVLMRLDAFKVQEISVTGNREISADDIRGVAEEYATGSVGFIFPKSNILLYPVSTVEASLNSKFPQLSEVLVTRTGLSAIHVQVLERQPRAMWCKSESLSDDECFLIDEKGYIYSKTTPDVLAVTSSATSTPLIYFYGGVDDTASSSLSSPIGATLRTTSHFLDILALVKNIQDSKLDAFGVLIVDNHEFSVLLSDGAELLFSDARPLDESFANLKTALSSDAFKATSSKATSATSTSKGFEYIDTRFGNKVFFKMKQ